MSLLGCVTSLLGGVRSRRAPVGVTSRLGGITSRRGGVSSRFGGPSGLDAAPRSERGFSLHVDECEDLLAMLTPHRLPGAPRTLARLEDDEGPVVPASMPGGVLVPSAPVTLAPEACGPVAPPTTCTEEVIAFSGKQPSEGVIVSIA